MTCDRMICKYVDERKQINTWTLLKWTKHNQKLTKIQIS